MAADWLKKKVEDPEERAFKNHLKALGLESGEAYVRWCKANGFSTGIFKTEDVRKKELKFLREQKIDSAFQKGKEAHAPLHKRIRLYLDQGREDNEIKSLKDSIRVAHGYRHTPITDEKEFFSFLSFLARESKILESKEAIPALLKVFQRKDQWIRPIEKWSPKTKNVGKQFSTLLRYLFTNYKIPDFMDQAWTEGVAHGAFNPSQDTYIDWFILLAQGKNLRTAEKLPFPLTKRMVHEFLKAPSNYTIAQALRHGQMMAMDMNPRLSAYVNATFLGRNFFAPDREEFWKSFMEFLSRQEFFDPNQVGSLTDYVQHQRFSPQAPQPNMSMRGRNVVTLLEECERWHTQIQKSRGKSYEEWPAQLTMPFSKEEKKGVLMDLWTVTELSNSKALEDEGRAMRHCVASYRYSCSRGHCSIWSLKLNGERIATIEVHMASKTVVQAKGKLNARVDGKPYQLLREWAAYTGYGLRV